jgi:hypothetical protein
MKLSSFLTKKKALLALVFVVSVLPTTAVVLLFTSMGLPFWVVGVIGFFQGKVDFLTIFQNVKSAQIALLWITGPLGLYGLYALWKLSYYLYKAESIPADKRRTAIVGLVAGSVAGVQMLMMQLGILFLALPSLLYFAMQLIRTRVSQLHSERDT